MRKFAVWSLVSIALMLIAGCSTNNTTVTKRSALEMQLLSHSTEQALGKINVENAVKGKKVFLDFTNLNSVDKEYVRGYTISMLGKNGALMVDDKKDAQVFAELSCGVLGTEISNFFLGIPSIQIFGFSTPSLPFFNHNLNEGRARFNLNISSKRQDNSKQQLLHLPGLTGEGYYTRWNIFFIPFTSSNLPDK